MCKENKNNDFIQPFLLFHASLCVVLLLQLSDVEHVPKIKVLRVWNDMRVSIKTQFSFLGELSL